MENKTPATDGGRGLETLAGTLKFPGKPCAAPRQPCCGLCTFYTTDITRHAGFGHCRRLDENAWPDAAWEMVSHDAGCSCFKPVPVGGSQ